MQLGGQSWYMDRLFCGPGFFLLKKMSLSTFSVGAPLFDIMSKSPAMVGHLSVMQ